MEINTVNLYEAFCSKDLKLDGKFFVGITSTGIYCRPICSARKPKLENCTFYQSAAEAEANGFRPCLRCRPECAPGQSQIEATSNIAFAAMKLLEQNCSHDLSIQSIAHKVGCSDRHLRRVFIEHTNVTPIQYLQTCRLLLAKQLLTETQLSITDVAMASGFGSLRRFNSLFKETYHLTPTTIRKDTQGPTNSTLSLLLSYRPPYLWEEHLEFLKKHAIQGLEVIQDGTYMRTVHTQVSDNKEINGTIKVSHVPDKHALSLTLSESLLPILPYMKARVQNVFDLNCDPTIIDHALKSMHDILGKETTLGLRIPGSFDPFELSVRTIIDQDTRLAQSRSHIKHLVQTLGTPLHTDYDTLTHTFPSVQTILDAGSYSLESLGLPPLKVKAILSLCTLIQDGKLDFNTPVKITDNLRILESIEGITPWTAQIIAMRAMGYTDAFVDEDSPLLQTVHPYTYTEIIQHEDAWRPWRSYALMNLMHTCI